jgi:periplasmic protein TonB
MQSSEIVSWAVAILLSMLVHAMIFMHGSVRPGVQNAPVAESRHVTRLNFSQAVQEPVPEEPRPIEKPPPKPKPVKTSKPKPKPKPETRPVKKIQPPKPVEKAVPLRQTTSAAQVRGQQVSKSSDGLLQARRQQYLHELLSHIESFKFYPRAARRRAIEGDVKISFVLRDDGHYEQLVLDGDESMLVKAAREALESAVPLPAPPGDINLSGRIEFTMAYSLSR